MKERPILFSGEMVRAILRGEKTQTRRVIQSPAKNMQAAGMRVITRYNPADHPAAPRDTKCAWMMRGRTGVWGGYTEEEFLARCPFGQLTDRLWVRETYALSRCWDKSRAGEMPVIRGDGVPAWYRGDEGVGRGEEAERGRWRPSIHMPRWASRLTLAVTSVRVERLQDISLADARAEGARRFDGLADPGPYPESMARWSMETPTSHTQCLGSPQMAVANYWIKLNGADSWAANPWVWVVGFKRVQP